MIAYPHLAIPTIYVPILSTKLSIPIHKNKIFQSKSKITTLVLLLSHSNYAYPIPIPASKRHNRSIYYHEISNKYRSSHQTTNSWQDLKCPYWSND